MKHKNTRRWVKGWIDPAAIIHMASLWSPACLATNIPLLLPPGPSRSPSLSVHALRDLFEFSVDMTLFHVQKDSLVKLLIAEQDPGKKESRDWQQSLNYLKKEFEASSKTWSQLIEDIEDLSPVFKFFWWKGNPGKPPEETFEKKLADG